MYDEGSVSEEVEKQEARSKVDRGSWIGMPRLMITVAETE